MTQRWTFSFEFMSNKEVTRWTVEASLCKSGCLNSKAVQLINNTEKLFFHWVFLWNVFPASCFSNLFSESHECRLFSPKAMLTASGTFKTLAKTKNTKETFPGNRALTNPRVKYVIPISDSTSKFLKAEVCKCHGKDSLRLLNLQEPICECVWRFFFSSTLETFIIQHFISILGSLFCFALLLLRCFWWSRSKRHQQQAKVERETNYKS